jgi:4-hydroxy-3-methylbut-2-enyl diphosphate reductase
MENAQRRFTVIDATCPRVLALQKFAGKVPAESELIMLGKPGHPEAEGVIGHSSTEKVYMISSLEEAKALPEMSSPVLLSQTTVSGELLEEVKSCLAEKYPGIVFSSRICDASDLRQQAVKVLATRCDSIIVVGSKHSSNACELYRIAGKFAQKACMVDSSKDIAPGFLDGCTSVGITAGASTPDELIDGVKSFLTGCGYSDAGVAE